YDLRPPLLPYTTLFRSKQRLLEGLDQRRNPTVHKRVRLRVDISPGGMRRRLRDGRNPREDDRGQLDADYRGVHSWHVSRRLLSRSEEHTSELQSRFDLV